MQKSKKIFFYVLVGMLIAVSTISCKTNESSSESLEGTTWVALLANNTTDVWKLIFTSSKDVTFIKMSGNGDVYSTSTGTYDLGDSEIRFTFSGTTIVGTHMPQTIRVALDNVQLVYSKQ